MLLVPVNAFKFFLTLHIGHSLNMNFLKILFNIKLLYINEKQDLFREYEQAFTYNVVTTLL